MLFRSGSGAVNATFTVEITGANDTPTLATPTTASYADTPVDDSFPSATGTLAWTERDTGQTPTYGITGGTVSGGDVSLAGTYGTLTVTQASGAYTFTPNASAINARSSFSSSVPCRSELLRP